MATERVRRVVAYLEEGNTDLSTVQERGLSATELAEVLERVAWGGRATVEVKEALERLYEARAADEEQAGLAMPLVVVKPQESRLWRSLTRLAMVLAAIGAVAAGILAWRVYSG